jgi:SAM-dependent methyltransferase
MRFTFKRITEAVDTNYISQPSQKISSAKTSINSGKLPAIFRLVKFDPNTVNLDYGGGKYDNATEYLKDMNVTNLIYDPYNRTAEHNKATIKTIRDNGGADTATLSNVLNVIAEDDVRLAVLKNIKKLLKPSGSLYVTVYEGDGTGEGKETSAGYQLNRKTKDYLSEIQQVFPGARAKGKLIISR